jgi:phosphatidate cytidylyltransferase
MALYGLVMGRFGVDISLWKRFVTGLAAGERRTAWRPVLFFIKRHFGIKDYGKVLPDMAVCYDRFDSTTFASPTVLIVL